MDRIFILTVDLNSIKIFPYWELLPVYLNEALLASFGQIQMASITTLVKESKLSLLATCQAN